MTTKTSGFLSLPDELLSAIVREIAAPEDLPTRCQYATPTPPARALRALSLVCRRIGRYAQLELHTIVEVGSAIGLLLLANTLSERSDLRSRVQSLRIEYRVFLDSTEPSQRAREYARDRHSDLSRPSVDASVYDCASRDLLSTSLPALKELSFSALPCALFVKVLARAGAAGITPNLHKLELQGDIDPARLSVWNSVAAFPNLKEIAFTGSWAPFPTIQDRFIALHGVQILRLQLDVWQPASLEPFAAPLNSLFPNINALQLEGEWDRDHLERLLATTPSSLVQLWLPVATGVIVLSSVLRLFPRLEDLRISGFLALHDVLSLVLPSKIRLLTISDETDLSVDSLSDLVLRSSDGGLTHIQLDAVPRQVATSDITDLLDFLLADAGAQSIFTEVEQLRNRYRPYWTDKFNPRALARLLRVAEVAGVRVTGRALKLLDWEDQFDEQLERQLVKQATEKDDYSVLLAYYGRDAAKDAIRRHRPAQAQRWMSSA